MDRSTSGDVIALQCFIVCQLLSRVNESNLVHLDPLLFLQRLFYYQNLVLWFKVEGLFSACKCLDEDLVMMQTCIVVYGIWNAMKVGSQPNYLF